MTANSTDDRKALAALIEWYAAMGADAIIGDAPIDRFAESAAPTARARAAPVAPMREPPPTPPAAPGRPTPRSGALGPTTPKTPAAATNAPDAGPAEAVMAARAEAGAATTLDNLRARLAAFDGCPLKVTARQLVFADGNPHAPMMLVGEAPGRDEDASGLPFVGRAGQLLDRMLAAIGLDRTGVYIANVIPWRPPGNRTPSDFETEVLKPFIRRQIELAAPEILVMLGGQSLKVLTGSTQGIIRSRGQWMSYRAGERDIPALPTLHPAFLLRQPIKKRDAWADFLKLKAKLAAVAGTLH